MNAETLPSPWGAPHPFLDRRYPPLSRAECARVLAQPGGEAELVKYVAERAERRAQALADPLKYGWKLAHWAEIERALVTHDEVYIPGGTGSAKTEFGGRLIVEWLLARRGVRVLAIAQNETCSKAFQQAAVYKYLPRSLRLMDAGPQKKRALRQSTKINYSLTGGFTDMVLAVNKSVAWFGTVAQYEKKEDTFEGRDFDLAVIDEGAPLTLIEKLRFRTGKGSVGKSGGKICYLLTSIDGYDAVFAQVLEGARVVQTLPMQWDWLLGEEGKGETAKRGDGEPAGGGVNPALTFPELDVTAVQVKGCPPGHMPFVMQPLNPAQRVIFGWTHWNPFLAQGSRWNAACPKVFDKCVGLPKWKARVRMFGWIERIMGAKIGNFEPGVHVIPHDGIAKLLAEKKLTTRLGADPHTARSYAMVWIGTAADGTSYLFDESPRADAEGEWVNANGEPGEGNTAHAHAGNCWYKKHIRERERAHGVPAESRWGDPRAFATAAGTAAGVRDLFNLFSEDHTGEDADFGPMYFQPASLRLNAIGETDYDLIVDMLRYDTARAEREGGLSAENRPRLFVSDRCRNVIRCWLNFDGDAHSPYKDFVDATRYALAAPLYYLDPAASQMQGGGGWTQRN
jgi:hypothetical protein